MIRLSVLFAAGSLAACLHATTAVRSDSSSRSACAPVFVSGPKVDVCESWDPRPSRSSAEVCTPGHWAVRDNVQRVFALPGGEFLLSTVEAFDDRAVEPEKWGDAVRERMKAATSLVFVKHDGSTT